jgi:ribosomal protein L7/L12
MDYSKTLDKLQLLINLVEETESEDINISELFETHLIVANGLMITIRDLHTGKKVYDEDISRETLVDAMRESNKIWRIRNRIKNGEIPNAHTVLDAEIEDYLTQGHKINAIKHYRTEMGKLSSKEPGLRESKDYVDLIHNDMKKRGLV